MRPSETSRGNASWLSSSMTSTWSRTPASSSVSRPAPLHEDSWNGSIAHVVAAAPDHRLAEEQRRHPERQTDLDRLLRTLGDRELGERLALFALDAVR